MGLQFLRLQLPTAGWKTKYVHEKTSRHWTRNQEDVDAKFLMFIYLFKKKSETELTASVMSQSRVLFLPPASHIQLTQGKLNCLFYVFMLYVAWKRGLPRKLARFVLFRPVKKRSCNFLCVLDLFSERWQSTLFHFFHHYPKVSNSLKWLFIKVETTDFDCVG